MQKYNFSLKVRKKITQTIHCEVLFIIFVCENKHNFIYMRKIITLATFLSLAFMANAQTAQDVLETAQKANDYFMAKYDDPTKPTFVRKIRPSSLWTRAVYYEGLMELYTIDQQQRYIDYAMRWADFHNWTPRNGVTTTDADDQCCGQTYYLLQPFTERQNPMEKRLLDMDRRHTDGHAAICHGVQTDWRQEIHRLRHEGI